MTHRYQNFSRLLYRELSILTGDQNISFISDGCSAQQMQTDEPEDFSCFSEQI